MPDPATPPKPRRRLFAAYHVEATAFLHEIINVADALREARAFDGEPALHFDRQSDLLRAIERCGGAPTFSDLGRLLRVSRQAARELALAAERRGAAELFTAPDDRRAIQVALSPRGRRVLEAQRMPDFAWLFMLLGGLEPPAMRSTSRVLRVIRQRLERDAAEQRRPRPAGDRPRRG